jgi:hypothetical protein
MHTLSLDLYVESLDRGDWPGVGELMLCSARKLATIGAACSPRPRCSEQCRATATPTG